MNKVDLLTLFNLAGATHPPKKVKVIDSYGNTLRMDSTDSGDISLAVITQERGMNSVTFAGVGGGDNRPLTKAALQLLAIALAAEPRTLRK
jgi:hypothetical protein